MAISMAERLVATYQERIPDGDGVEEFVNLWETVKTMRDELVGCRQSEIQRSKRQRLVVVAGNHHKQDGRPS